MASVPLCFQLFDAWPPHPIGEPQSFRAKPFTHFDGYVDDRVRQVEDFPWPRPGEGNTEARRTRRNLVRRPGQIRGLGCFCHSLLMMRPASSDAPPFLAAGRLRAFGPYPVEPQTAHIIGPSPTATAGCPVGLPGRRCDNVPSSVSRPPPFRRTSWPHGVPETVNRPCDNRP